MELVVLGALRWRGRGNSTRYVANAAFTSNALSSALLGILVVVYRARATGN